MKWVTYAEGSWVICVWTTDSLTCLHNTKKDNLEELRCFVIDMFSVHASSATAFLLFTDFWRGQSGLLWSNIFLMFLVLEVKVQRNPSLAHRLHPQACLQGRGEDIWKSKMRVGKSPETCKKILENIGTKYTVVLKWTCQTVQFISLLNEYCIYKSFLCVLETSLHIVCNNIIIEHSISPTCISGC